MNSTQARSSSHTPLILIISIFMFVACGGEAGGNQNDDSTQAEPAQITNPGKLFDDSVKEDKCSLLTTTQVAAAVSVPETAVDLNPSFCLYEWEGGNIYLSSVRVHDSIEHASKYYARNTRDFTSEDMRAAKEALKQKLEESDSGSEISQALIDAAPEDSVNHQRWDDIGSEAAWNGSTTMIRYGNVTVKFSGKTHDRNEGEDWVDPQVARAIARSILSSLDEAA